MIAEAIKQYLAQDTEKWVTRTEIADYLRRKNSDLYPHDIKILENMVRQGDILKRKDPGYTAKVVYQYRFLKQRIPRREVLKNVLCLIFPGEWKTLGEVVKSLGEDEPKTGDRKHLESLDNYHIIEADYSTGAWKYRCG